MSKIKIEVAAVEFFRYAATFSIEDKLRVIIQKRADDGWTLRASPVVVPEEKRNVVLLIFAKKEKA